MLFRVYVTIHHLTDLRNETCVSKWNSHRGIFSRGLCVLIHETKASSEKANIKVPTNI